MDRLDLRGTGRAGGGEDEHQRFFFSDLVSAEGYFLLLFLESVGHGNGVLQLLDSYSSVIDGFRAVLRLLLSPYNIISGFLPPPLLVLEREDIFID